MTKEVGAYYGKLISDRVDGDSARKKGLESSLPDFSSMSVSKSGDVRITFSVSLLQKELAAINSDALEIALISNTNVPGSKKTFTWTAVEFHGNILRIKVTFDAPLLISSESLENLDELKVSVKNPFVYRSADNLEMVPRGTWIEASIP